MFRQRFEWSDWQAGRIQAKSYQVWVESESSENIFSTLCNKSLSTQKIKENVFRLTKVWGHQFLLVPPYVTFSGLSNFEFPKD